MIITGLIGYPLHHTRSPQIHNAAFRHLHLRGIYLPLPTPVEQLGGVVRDLRSGKFRGVNVTIPYKEKVLELLDWIAPEAENIRAVNTILVRNGKLCGYNTDLDGFKAALQERGIEISGRSVLLLGAGGAGRACARILTDQQPKRFFVMDNDLLRARDCAAMVQAEAVHPDRLKHLLQDGVRVVVNATPQDLQAVVFNRLQTGGIYIDLNYQYPAKPRPGVQYYNGLDMLVYQAAHAFRLWTRRRAPLAVMKAAVEAS